MDSVDVGGLRIGFERAGSGPPLLLLHGALCDRRSWRRQLDALADEFTVVAWDTPGFGGSSDPPEGFGLDGFADCVAGLAAALELDRPHILGLSFGGGLAIEVSRRHPDLPRSLVLASAYAGWAGSLPADEVERRVERALDEAERPPQQWVDGYLPGLFTEAASAEVVAELRTMMLDTRGPGHRAMLLAFARADLRDALPRITVPTLLLYGGVDRRSPPHVAEELHAQIPTSQLVVLPGVGHSCNLESPDRFNAEVRAFLRSVPAPDPAAG